MAQKTRKEHYAFTLSYDRIVKELLLPCEVVIPGASSGEKFNFIWDTGATCSVITKTIVDSLGL
ncbi:MAG: hypothetical protein AAF975_03670, partial [Spirochaetota bacterium]